MRRCVSSLPVAGERCIRPNALSLRRPQQQQVCAGRESVSQSNPALPPDRLTVPQTVEVTFVEEEGVLQVGARRIGWMVRGPHDGRRVGWFHGQPGSRKDVRAFTEETLERAKVQLFAVDRAGYGDTSFIGAGHSEDAAD